MPMSEEARARIGEATKKRHEAKKAAALEAAQAAEVAQPDPKVGFTDKQRRELAEAQAEVRAKRQAAKELEEQADRIVPPPPPPVPPTPVPAAVPEPTITQTEYNDLLRQIAELKRNASSQFTQTPTQQQPQVNQRGQLIGTFEKYVIDPKNYADPTTRLSQEPRLRRFAFSVNYELSWAVTRTQYQTQDGVNTAEPRFTVELIKVVLDEETGEPTTGRYVLRTLILHEDPQAALVVARDNGVDPDLFGGERSFLDEMRYLRIRDWLLEAFYPPRTTVKKNKREAVIGNRVVQLYEISSVEAAAIDFKS